MKNYVCFARPEAKLYIRGFPLMQKWFLKEKIMWQTVFLYTAVYVMFCALFSIINKFMQAAMLARIAKVKTSLVWETLFISLSLTYIIWYCN